MADETGRGGRIPPSLFLYPAAAYQGIAELYLRLVAGQAPSRNCVCGRFFQAFDIRALTARHQSLNTKERLDAGF